MRQLTSLDAQFLAIEDGKTHGHVSGLGIDDPTTAPGGALTLDAVRGLVASRLDRLPPFRWRLAEVPLGLDNPYWFDDPRGGLDFGVVAVVTWWMTPGPRRRPRPRPKPSSSRSP